LTSKQKYKFSKQTIDENCESIDCPAHDTYKDFKRDPTGCYVLVKVNKGEGHIEVALCNKNHHIMKVFKGSTPQQIYHHIFKYEKSQKHEWFKEKDHMAYLGKELARAELMLNSKIPEYLQE